jgi:acyl-CoA reductase-like NAD-dependent aldehyde dehydrogenase
VSAMKPPVRKTYKLYIGGRFPRSESGRAYQPDSSPQHNVTRASRKDLRDAVVAARAALPGWSRSAPYLRGQILYRLAEMLETHRDSLAGELVRGGAAQPAARRELDAAISLCTWYAGLPDKLQGLLGSQNAVSGPFFSFSTVEPTGVIGALAPPAPALLGLVALLLPLLAGGNTVVALVSERAPFAALALGELLMVSDFPAGVVNLLAGRRAELAPWFASHRAIDGLFAAGAPEAALGQAAADSTKRVRWLPLPEAAWRRPQQLRSLHFVAPFVEVKTFWHPVQP